MSERARRGAKGKARKKPLPPPPTPDPELSPRIERFLFWEASSRDTIDVKRCYIDLAGDLPAGVLLSQIMFWHLPAAAGGATDKLMIERDGRRWLAKQRDDWWAECRLSPKQFDRAVRVLEKRGLVFTANMRFGGSPTRHVSVNWPVFLDRLRALAVAAGKMEVDERSKSNSTKREDRTSPFGKMELDVSSTSITKTTPQNTSESTSEKRRLSARAPSHVARARAEEKSERGVIQTMLDETLAQIDAEGGAKR